MGSVKEYKCINCGAGLEFDPASQSWKCTYCFSEFSKDEIETAFLKEQPLDRNMPELDSYHCTSCGAELIADNTTSATFCLYCRNHSIIKSRFAGKFKPKNLIPFKITKEQAKDIYKKWIGKRIFAPKEFKQKEEIDKVTGIYAPFWLFDCKGDGMISGEGTRVNSWTSGKYRYTKTKYYRVARKGNAEYHKVPVDASKKLDDKYMHMIEPYNYNDLTDFSMEYMSGFMAEKYDVEASAAETVMKERVEKYLEDRLKETVNGYSSFVAHEKKISVSDIHELYSMLPIYLLNNKYNGKDHIFIVNGQTGKVVGDTPISHLKQFMFTGVVFIIVWAISVFGGALFV
jgi:DNA-directed RNA polymerase subunit RPC12/RpoP